jgi:hypothetical protein
MKSVLLITAFLLATSPSLFTERLFAQRVGELWWYAYPFEAEAIRLGGAYTAVGRGLASMHSNSAALGFQEGAQVLYSSGRSFEWPDAEFNYAYDIAAAVHIPGWRTTLGISLDADKQIYESNDTNEPFLFHIKDRLFGIHLARRMTDWLSLGLAIRRYEYAFEEASYARERAIGTAVGWDLSVSANGRHKATLIGRPSDEIRYGFTADNILGTRIWFTDESHTYPLHQTLRFGTAYLWRPEWCRIWNADLFTGLVTVESSLQGTDHEFRTWGTIGGGAELRILEVLMISAGVENIMRLGNRIVQWPEYPVFRYGAGLDIPLHRLLDMDIPFALQLDYAHTVWNDDVNESGHWDPDKHTQQVNAFSVQLRTEFF